MIKGDGLTEKGTLEEIEEKVEKSSVQAREIKE